jgi:putative heme transporter
VPLTPGGVGVVEAALAAGLTAAGAPALGAAAAVLVYRLISCWLFIPVGGLAALALRRDRRSVNISPQATAIPPNSNKLMRLRRERP